MKKIVVIILVIVLSLFSFSACSTDSSSTETSTAVPTDSPTKVPTQEPTEAPTQAPSAEPTTEPTKATISNDKPYDVVYTELFEVFNPFTEILSDELLAQIGADGFSGTDLEIANQILKWQGSNMKYIGNPMEKEDVAYPMRWNYCLPGIFPVSEMVSERVLNDGKIYGLCWDYASIYCSIATTYGLETRVVAAKEKLSDIDPTIDKDTADGLSFEEYEIFREKLLQKDVDFTFDQITKIAKETWAHYSAEVLIDGSWVSMDGSSVQDYDNLEEVTWYEGYNNEALYAPNTDLSNLDKMCEALASAPASDYVGITDDAGNTNRAATIEDLNAGKGLAPYFDNPQDAIDFLSDEPDIAADLMSDAEEIKEEVESVTGEAFYILADALIFSAVEEIEAKEYIKYYEAITGETLPLAVVQSIVE